MADKRIIRAVPAMRTPMTDRRTIRNQDPNYHYHIARNDPDRIRYLVEALHYEVVREGQAKVKDPLSTDGAVMVGGDVVVRCKREEYEKRVREKEVLARQALLGPRETFKSEARKRGVETIDLSRESRGPMSDVLHEKDVRISDSKEE